MRTHIAVRHSMMRHLMVHHPMVRHSIPAPTSSSPAGVEAALASQYLAALATFDMQDLAKRGYHGVQMQFPGRATVTEEREHAKCITHSIYLVSKSVFRFSI